MKRYCLCREKIDPTIHILFEIISKHGESRVIEYKWTSRVGLRIDGLRSEVSNQRWYDYEILEEFDEIPKEFLI